MQTSMSETNVADRLKFFIEQRGLTSSQFADMCGIPRPSLSQLLTGRNKKISDVVIGQIHNMFPDLSIVWLLFGEGEMETNVGKNDKVRNESKENIFNDDLFSIEDLRDSEPNKIVFSSQPPIKSQISEGKGLNHYEELSKAAEIKIDKLQNKIKDLQIQIDNYKKNPRRVSHITVYYDDYTFETFFPR